MSLNSSLRGDGYGSRSHQVRAAENGRALITLDLERRHLGCGGTLLLDVLRESDPTALNAFSSSAFTSQDLSPSLHAEGFGTRDMREAKALLEELG